MLRRTRPSRPTPPRLSPSRRRPPPIVLEGSGLRIPGESPPRSLGFDTSEAETIAALTKALGRPPTERGENEECGGGGMKFAEWKDEITVWFLDQRFAGWDSEGGLKTLEGIGVGSRHSELVTLPGFEVEESTLGTEFRSGGLSGILDSKAPGRESDRFVGRRDVRLPLGLAFVAAALAGCSPGSAPERNVQEPRNEAAETMPLANASDSVAPEPVAEPRSAAIAASTKGVRRCGWLSNPTPANWWLTDSQGQWILGTQGADQAPGMDEMPDMSTAGWVETNGPYGYGCACMTIAADAEGKVTRISDATPRPLKQCQADRKLPKPE